MNFKKSTDKKTPSEQKSLQENKLVLNLIPQ